MLKAGDTIGTYRVVRPLGAGGMGQVYLVEHSHLRKRYALKILPPDVSADANFIDRFRIEARVMADLEHPCIVRVHNFGEDQGRHFLVMDYVEGPDGSPRTLEDELSWGNKLSEHVVLAMAIQLCDALEYAHSFPQGSVIHRDLKPGNILIYKSGQKTSASGKKPTEPSAPELRVKIADFGLAKIVGTDYIREVIDRSTTLTAVATRPPKTEEMATMVNSSVGSSVPLLGTYDYMSPEQKTGAAVDARSDLYALGLILYRMLTGHRPEGTYDPPSKSGCRRRWDAIIAKCLKRELEARYQDAGQIKRDLLTLNEPTHKHPAVRAVAAGAIALVVGIGLYGIVSRPSVPNEDGEEILPITSDATAGLHTLKVNVQPTGATLRVTQKKTLISESVLHRKDGTKVKLKPGLYTFELKLPGYRPVIQELPVGPEHNDTWTVTMIDAFGFLHVQQPEGDTIDIRPVSGRDFTASPPQLQGTMRVYKLPIDRYEVVVTRTNYLPSSFKADITETSPVNVKVEMKPMPGSVLIVGDPDVEIWHITTLFGRAGEWIRDVPTGTYKLHLRRPGYRNTDLSLEMLPNGELTIPAPEMEQQAATLTISVDARGGETIDPNHMPRSGMIRVGNGELQEIQLPWSVVLHEMNTELPLELVIPGYAVVVPESIKLHDREERKITARLSPLPVTVTILSDVPANITRIHSDHNTGLRRLFGGKDKVIGHTGEPFTIEPFVTHKLAVSTSGYATSIVEVISTTPGTTNEPIQVSLEPAAP
jgi:serine/threonine protein kinase